MSLREKERETGKELANPGFIKASANVFAFSYVYKMYNIYVTNKSKQSVYVRLQSQKISTLNESFHHELERLGGGENPTDGSQPQQSVNSYLVRWGFCNIPTKATMPFAAEVHNDEPRMYASLYARSKLWIMDYEVNCARYGCLSVDGTITELTWRLEVEQELRLTKANPNPVWIPRKAGDPVNKKGLTLRDIIKAGTDTVEGNLYFGRSSFGGSKPCKVTTKKVEGQLVVDRWKTVDGQEALRGEVLKDNGHELVRTKIGDPVPPNAVIAGVSDTDGTLYLGRVGGNIPCAVSAESDRIKHFCFYTDGVKQVESGEIVVLTK